MHPLHLSPSYLSVLTPSEAGEKRGGTVTDIGWWAHSPGKGGSGINTFHPQYVSWLLSFKFPAHASLFCCTKRWGLQCGWADRGVGARGGGADQVLFPLLSMYGDGAFVHHYAHGSCGTRLFGEPWYIMNIVSGFQAVRNLDTQFKTQAVRGNPGRGATLLTLVMWWMKISSAVGNKLHFYLPLFQSHVLYAAFNSQTEIPFFAGQRAVLGNTPESELAPYKSMGSSKRILDWNK